MAQSPVPNSPRSAFTTPPADLSRSGGIADKTISSGQPVKGPSFVAFPAVVCCGRSTTAFVENQGQFDPRVKFRANIGGKVLWFTSTGLVIDVTRPVAASEAADSRPGMMHGPAPAKLRAESTSPMPSADLERLAFSEEFADANASPRIAASAAEPGTYNYFIGNNPKNWRTGIVAYSQLLYRDVWPGIDVQFIAKGPDIEQEFLVHPGADSSRIQVAYRGAERVQVAKDGSLVVETLLGSLREGSPQIYQEERGRRTWIHGSYKFSGDLAYAFELGPYSEANTLVIDPTLLFSTYLGGTGSDYGMGIALDPAGNTYVAGYTVASVNGPGTFPTTLGALQATCPSTYPCVGGFVSKFDPLGRLQYSTYLGSPNGQGGDSARGIAVDPNGEAFVTGLAQAGFPTTANAFQNTCNASSFMAKLNSTGTTLLYSTCLGAEGYAAEYGVGAYAIAIDANARAYVTGNTSNYAALFPTTSSALQPTIAGPTNAFVSLIDPSLSGVASLVYSTYLGGGVQDWDRAIAVDGYGAAYITGSTYSPNFPVTPNAFQALDKQGYCGNVRCATAYVAKLNPSVSGPTGLIYSSYLGGGDSGYGVGDTGYGIAVDASGDAFIGGTTGSLNFPVTSGAFQTSSNCGYGSGFVAKVNAGGSALIYSTFLTGGGACTTVVAGIALDSSNNAYVVGGTRSPTFPVTPNAFQNTNHGGSNSRV
jgi:hypothetical protein